ncbi:type-F conjugative transfer system pilin assembly thiol-disulfide isomerase TrbB [Escherichia coli]|nr:type-F conjugative transfer system pilin assembly thiol-disulfide isomerase TrbB [Escherichia coli]MDE3872244.1 type-F conjugative transfer system pilin assembly thiol-disulfide isomerase TrbB [Escherichia coli]MDE3882779.1 type-F conjugative transfer system pilin assembly thiol-disulfide isomerase TrbB [Escherichia coli]MDE3891325.1 type-F conjugative transfer system pilin assembly thiol-disulfide isomerase TrbB [Escherichia coli]MDE3895631.1 type-F conjugative transfer system pilin assembl
MSLIKSLLFTLLLAAAAVQASTRDEIERLWNPQGMAAQPAQPAADTSARTEKPAPRWFRLSNGRQVNLADWKVVLFMQGHCPYCHQFDPVLKQLAQQYGFSVFPYTLDGQGDTAFPEALPVPPDVMQTFFPNIPVATPTTFLVNVNTLEALPLLQGATDAAGFMARMDTVLQMYGGKKVRNKQVVLLIAGISGIATGIIVSLNIPFIRQGLFYPASPVEIVVSLCLTFSVSVVFFVGAIVGWISVSEIYYSRRTGRKYRDIPAETPYAPGEQIKGGQE